MIPMRLIAASDLIAFGTVNPASTAALNNFRQMVRTANWRSMDDVRAAASTVKILNGERARFEVAGGRFRLIVAINFTAGIVFVKFVGTHAEYDKVDALTVSQF
jgi:mRNA interferase HigB